VVQNITNELSAEKEAHNWSKVLLEDEKSKCAIGVAAIRKLQVERKQWTETSKDLERCKQVVSDQEEKLAQNARELEHQAKAHKVSF
jgi:hypothetical protein